MGIDRLARILSLRLRSLLRRGALERELDEELEYHLEQQTAENIRRGMAPADARRAALRSFGGVDFQKERVRDTRGLRWLEEPARDIRFALRSLRRAPGFTTTVVLTLALGLGANTAMFTLLRGTLLRRLPNEDEGRLVYLRLSAPGEGQADMSFSVPEVNDLRAARTLRSIAEYSNVLPMTVVGRDGSPVEAQSAVVSGNYFDVVGLEPLLGRLMTPADDGAAAAPVAVLSYRFWREHFGGDRRVVGRTLRINDRISTVLGVLPPLPEYPLPTDVYVNTVTSPHHLSATMVTGRTHRMTELFARLAPNATVEQARDEINRIAANVFRDHPDAYEKAAHYEITLYPLRQAMNERAALTFWLLMGAATLVLLIACANVSNLTLMRGVGREQEMTMRAALGAGAGRLRRLLLAENLVLAIIGGALGVLVAFAGLRLLTGFAAQLSPRASEIRVDGLVLAVGLTTSIIVAIALAFVPRIGRGGALASSLAPAGRRATLGRGRQRFQQSLVAAQIAVCMVLLTGAGLLIRTLVQLEHVDTGVRADHALALDLPLQGDLIKELMKTPEHLGEYERMRDRVATLPGVQVVSLANAAPLRISEIAFEVKADGRVNPPDRPTPHAALKTVDPAYFAAAGIPLLTGRTFEVTDRAGTQRVVLLNKSFAQELFGDENPIGKRVAWTGEVLKFTPISGDWRTVVGVVGDTRDGGLANDPLPTMYSPFAQEPIMGASMIVRATGDPAALQPTIARSIRAAFPGQLIEKEETLQQTLNEAVATRRLNAMFITSFGVLAFVIAMVGIAGVLAFSVSSRTQEIGIRMSLGADAGRVHRMILGEGGALLAAGLGVGLPGALLSARLLRGLLFGVAPSDPFTLVTVALMLTAVGVAACWLPAARAASVDPAVALRSE